MQRYIARRILLLFPVLFGVSLFVFVLARVLPGDIATLLAQDAMAGTRDIQALRVELGLNKSLPEQYVDWLTNLAQGNLGKSLWTKEPVLDEILSRWPVTVELAVLAMLFSIGFGVPAGIISAVRQDSWLDYVTRLLAISGLAMPSFWLGILVITLPALWFGWTPPLRYRPLLSDPWANLQQFLIPAFVLGVRMSAILARMTRSTILEVQRQDYIRTAWSKGLRERSVMLRHALKNALIPVVTLCGNQFGYLLGGTVIIETVFSLPGIGRLVLDSIMHRDYPQIQANILLVATTFVLINLVIDISYSFLDPRIRHA
ncbi:MAG: ABC transporter permease [Candidatus Marsarchaeota archaeon]|nr:ABC transporter permease [Candidatus Marsarchaeota archaeon]